MRTNLSKVFNQYVLCVGWIDAWWDLDDGQRRYCVKNPTIKLPNKNLLFDDLSLISKEDHINFFIPKEKVNYYLCLTNENSTHSRFEKIFFSGIVKGYKRSDGSSDYGVYPTKFFDLHFDLQDLNKDIEQFHDERDGDPDFFTRNTLLTLEYELKPRVHSLRKKLEESGDQLPTFVHTYQDYVQELEEHLDGIQSYINKIRTFTSSRKFRRLKKLKHNFSIDIRPFEELYPNCIFNPINT